MKCLIDNTEHDNINELHAHLKKLRVTQEYYYLRYLPRKDLLTGQPIPFKSYSDYIQSDFILKNNLKKYCTQNPTEGIKWGINFLKKRAAEKKTIRAFHHVELRSLFCPTVRYFEEYGDYNKICKEIGLEIPFNYKEGLIFEHNLVDPIINCDTREQKLINFKTVKTKIQKIDYGDYSINSPYDSGIYIEKKSLGDFINSFGKDIDRLRRELDRCKRNNHYMVILVQSNMSEALSFNYSYEGRYARATPEFVFGNIRKLLHSYDNLQFLFIDKIRSEEIVLKLFSLGKYVRTNDLQFFYETKKL